MKKITLFIFLMIYSFGNSQEFPIDFSNENQLFIGAEGCLTSIVNDPIDTNNLVLQVVGGGKFYDNAQLNLATNLNLADNALNTITFRVKPIADYGTRTHALKFEKRGPGSGPDFAELTFTTTGTEWQNISLNFGSNLGNYGLAVIFTDFANNLTGTYLFDDFSGATNSPPIVIPAPTTAAPRPPNRNASDVISLYSNVYTNMTIDNWNAGPSINGYGRVTTNVLVEGNETKRVEFPGFMAVDFSTLANHVDLTSMERFHMDIWTQTATLDKSFNLKFSNFKEDNTEELSAIEFSFRNASIPALPNPNPGTWISIDMPLSAWTGAAAGGSKARNNIAKFFVTSDLGMVYFDNVYVYKGTSLGITNFEKSNLKVYPNPATTNVTIEANNTIERISVFNILGQEVLSKSPKANTTSLDISYLQKGTYMLRTTSEGKTVTTKVIKK